VRRGEPCVGREFEDGSSHGYAPISRYDVNGARGPRDSHLRADTELAPVVLKICIRSIKLRPKTCRDEISHSVASNGGVVRI
jgi:hypothetical protein